MWVRSMGGGSLVWRAVVFVGRATAGGLLVWRAFAHRDGKVGDLRNVGRDGGIRGGEGWGGGDGGEDDNIMGCSMGRGRGRVVPSGINIGLADNLYRCDIFDIKRSSLLDNGLTNI
mgnify:CR=1 FL=1